MLMLFKLPIKMSHTLNNLDLNKTVIHKLSQVSVDGAQTNIRNPFSDSAVDPICRRMAFRGSHDFENLFALFAVSHRKHNLILNITINKYNSNNYYYLLVHIWSSLRYELEEILNSFENATLNSKLYYSNLIFAIILK